MRAEDSRKNAFSHLALHMDWLSIFAKRRTDSEGMQSVGYDHEEGSLREKLSGAYPVRKYGDTIRHVESTLSCVHTRKRY